VPTAVAGGCEPPAVVGGSDPPLSGIVGVPGPGPAADGVASGGVVPVTTPVVPNVVACLAAPEDDDGAIGRRGEGGGCLEDKDGVWVAERVEGQGPGDAEGAVAVHPGRQGPAAELGGDRGGGSAGRGLVVGRGEIVLGLLGDGVVDVVDAIQGD